MVSVVNFLFNLKYLIMILIYFNNICSFLSSFGFSFYNMHNSIQMRYQLHKKEIFIVFYVNSLSLSIL
jgi:hypothetical protein